MSWDRLAVHQRDDVVRWHRRRQALAFRLGLGNQVVTDAVHLDLVESSADDRALGAGRGDRRRQGDRDDGWRGWQCERLSSRDCGAPGRARWLARADVT